MQHAYQREVFASLSSDSTRANSFCLFCRRNNPKVHFIGNFPTKNHHPHRGTVIITNDGSIFGAFLFDSLHAVLYTTQDNKRENITISAPSGGRVGLAQAVAAQDKPNCFSVSNTSRLARRPKKTGGGRRGRGSGGEGGRRRGGRGTKREWRKTRKSRRRRRKRSRTSAALGGVHKPRSCVFRVWRTMLFTGMNAEEDIV